MRIDYGSGQQRRLPHNGTDRGREGLTGVDASLVASERRGGKSANAARLVLRALAYTAYRRGWRRIADSLPHRGGLFMLTILLIVLLLMLVGALPSWPYSRGWGYYPSSGLGLVVVVLVVLLVMGRI